MTSCNHRPVFKIKMLFARKPQYICKKCGAEVEMTAQTKMISRLINGLTIGALVYLALNGNFTKTDTNATLLYFLSMAGIVVGFLVFQTLLAALGKFQEIEAGDETLHPEDSAKATGIEPGNDYGNGSGIDSSAQNGDNSDAVAGSDTESDAGSETESSGGSKIDVSGDTSQYTKEQLELMALYESYAKLDHDEAEAAAAQAKPEPKPEEAPCDHVPAKNWKNYVPGIYDFKCEKCGKPISFTQARKKSLNMLLLVFSSVIVMVSFSTSSLPFWGFILLTIGVVIACTAIQIYFVKHSQFEVKEVPAK